MCKRFRTTTTENRRKMFLRLNVNIPIVFERVGYRFLFGASRPPRRGGGDGCLDHRRRVVGDGCRRRPGTSAQRRRTCHLPSAFVRRPRTLTARKHPPLNLEDLRRSGRPYIPTPFRLDGQLYR